jgi:NADH-quinone oxidoreductase subunit N
MMLDALLIIPELFIVLTLILLLIGEVTYRGEKTRLLTATTLVGLAGAFFQALVAYRYGAAQIFHHALSIDGLALFFKTLFIGLGFLAVIASSQSREIETAERAEYQALTLLGCLAMIVAAESAHLLLGALALLVLNVVGFLLASFKKKSVASTEAGVKLLMFGAVSGMLMAFGIAVLFSETGSLNIYEVHRALGAGAGSPQTLLISFGLLFLSLCFQLAAFPMYLWAPDVFQGAPTPSSAFLSVGIPAAGFAVAIRWLLVVFAIPGEGGAWAARESVPWSALLALAAALTMLAGSLLAVRQNSAKRMVGCLVVAQSGFGLLGLLVLDETGFAALLFQLLTGVVAGVGSYFILSVLHDEIGSDDLSRFNGMLKRAVPECICLILCLLTWLGLPPSPGFAGKFALIGSVFRQGWTLLAMIAVASLFLSVVAAARLAYSLMGEPPSWAVSTHSDGATSITSIAPSWARSALLVLLVVPILLAAVFSDALFRWSGASLSLILW